MKPQEIKISKYYSDYYPILCTWWLSHGWPSVPQECLPENGYIISQGDVPVCAGFLYLTDSNMALSEWIVANKEIDYETRGICLDILIETLTFRAKELNYKNIFTTVVHKRLVERYEKHGYTKTDTDVVNMIKQL